MSLFPNGTFKDFPILVETPLACTRSNDMRALPNILVCFIFLISFSPVNLALAEDAWFSHEVSISKGVGTVTAELKLPAPPSTTYKVLADYAHWPDLFPRHPVILSTTRDNNRVQVAMQIPAQFIPVNLELVTSTLESPPHRLETTLVKGDFDRYDWTWDLSQSSSDKMTIATLTLVVQPSIWVPEWLLQWLLESEITTHFHLLREQVLARHQEQQRSQIINANSP